MRGRWRRESKTHFTVKFRRSNRSRHASYHRLRSRMTLSAVIACVHFTWFPIKTSSDKVDRVTPRRAGLQLRPGVPQRATRQMTFRALLFAAFCRCRKHKHFHWQTSSPRFVKPAPTFIFNILLMTVARYVVCWIRLDNRNFMGLFPPTFVQVRNSIELNNNVKVLIKSNDTLAYVLFYFI